MQLFNFYRLELLSLFLLCDEENTTKVIQVEKNQTVALASQIFFGKN